MIENYIVFLLIIIIVCSEACAQYYIKKCRVDGTFKYMLISIFFYTIVSFTLYLTYQYKAIGVINALWSALSVIMITSVGVYFYHETLNYYDYFGMFLIIIGIYYVFVRGHE